MQVQAPASVNVNSPLTKSAPPKAAPANILEADSKVAKISLDSLTTTKRKPSPNLTIEGLFGGGLAGAAVAVFPASGVYLAGLVMKSPSLNTLSTTVVGAGAASGLAAGLTSAFGTSMGQSQTIGTLTGLGVGAAMGYMNGGNTGAVISGLVGIAAGYMGSSIAASIHVEHSPKIQQSEFYLSEH